MQSPEDFPLAFQEAWNAHSMPALGALFSAQATFVNRFGHLVEGIEAIVALHEPIHRSIYRDSTLENRIIKSTRITGDVVVIHCLSRLHAGAAHPAGRHTVETIIQAVITRSQGSWLVDALENVAIVDPRTGAPGVWHGR